MDDLEEMHREDYDEDELKGVIEELQDALIKILGICKKVLGK